MFSINSRNLNLKSVFTDLIAGLTVAVILIPQAMAYAVLAGMPAVYGLYASLIPLIVYPIFASSVSLSIGPVALISIILLAGISVYAIPFSPEYINLVLLTGLFAGLFQMLYAILRLGKLSHFLSKPVLSGFISAAGVIIAISQLKHLLGIQLERRDNLFLTLVDLFQKIPEVNLYSLGIGTAAIGMIYFLKFLHKAIPAHLIVTILAILAFYFLGLEKYSVATIGEIQAGLSAFDISFLQDLSFSKIRAVIPTAFIVSIICFISSYAIASSFQYSQQNKVLANKELLSLGLAKIVGSFFLAYPSSGSFSRSAVNNQSGAKTGLSSVFTAIVVGICLLFFTGLFSQLAMAVLSAIILSSVLGFVDLKEMKRLWKINRRDFWTLIVTFFLTLILGIVPGIMGGIILSLLSVVIRSSNPHFAILGKLPKAESYRNIKRYPEASTIAGTFILRYDMDLFFANADHFYNVVIEGLENSQDVDTCILHLGPVNYIDSSAMVKIHDLISYCNLKGVTLHFTNLIGVVRDQFANEGIFEKISPKQVHLSINDALSSDRAKSETGYATQVNR